MRITCWAETLGPREDILVKLIYSTHNFYPHYIIMVKGPLLLLITVILTLTHCLVLLMTLTSDLTLLSRKGSSTWCREAATASSVVGVRREKGLQAAKHKVLQKHPN